MTIVEKFNKLPLDKQELVIDQLVKQVKLSNDPKFALLILANNLGLNGTAIIDKIKASL